MISFFCLSLVVKVIGHLGVELLKSLLGRRGARALVALGLEGSALEVLALGAEALVVLAPLGCEGALGYC